MKQILFITLSNIGDAVMTIPALARLHQLYPQAKIDLVCDPRSSVIFEHCPYRGDIILKIKKQGKKGLWQLIKNLRRKRYDLIVDLRTDGLSYLLRAKKRLTKLNRKPYGPHAVEDLISIIDKINPEKIIPPAAVWLDNNHIEQAKQLTADLPGNNWLCIGPGANWAPKIWASENFAQVANHLKSAFDAVIIVGGPGDKSYCDKTEALIKFPVLNLCEKTGLLTATAVMQQCRLFIGNDSGLGHLASAAGTASISVFGPGRPSRYHPYSAKNQWLQGDNESLEAVTPESIIELAEKSLSDS